MLPLPPQCPDTLDPRDTCVLNPLREPFAKKECSVLLSEVFETCHPVVSGCQAPLLLRFPPHPTTSRESLESLLPSDPLPCLGLEGRLTSAVPLPLACSDDSVLFPQMTQDRQTVKQLLCPFQAYLLVALPPDQAVLLNGEHRPLVLWQQPSAGTEESWCSALHGPLRGPRRLLSDLS